MTPSSYHADLVASVRGLLALGGELYFSTNLRTFRLDPALAADTRCQDISARTLPEDFRDRRVHHAFRLTP
jgi:23S rRNA (cytosine1962-C5)-methyltransferase